MAPSIDSIPSLVPVSTHSPATKQNHEIDEAMIDKFATLFSPPTPRASPTLEKNDNSIWKIPSTSQKPQPWRPNHERTPSADSDFGAFVSVPASEDPLAVETDFNTFSFADASPLSLSSSFPSNLASGAPPSPAATSKSVNSNGHGHASNPSLSFFEEFAREAKDANERNRRDILDEIERDLMFTGWNAAEAGGHTTHPSDRPHDNIRQEEYFDVVAGTNTRTTTSSTTPPPTQDPDAWGPPELTQSLIDLDQDFFSLRERHHRRARTEGHPPMPTTPKSSVRSKSNSPSISPFTPSRSPTLSTATVAPPIASTSPPPDFGPPMRPVLTERDRSQSSSYQTLTNISSKWIGGLLSASSSSASSQPLPSSVSRSGGPTPTPAHTHTHIPVTLSTTASQRVRVSVDSIFSGLGEQEPVHHGPSPFGPHPFMVGSISGAPGFVPDGWDKGYSDGLREEFRVGAGGNGSGREGRKNGSSDSASASRSRSKSPLPGVASSLTGENRTIGKWIEKKGGMVELKGRKESTEGVLDGVVAERIRTYLPALSRIPRTWNLLYSLNQHGISLNTLYTQSEAAPQLTTTTSGGFATRLGALVVIKDSSDTIFGVYVSDGIRRGRGYYGSGDSFMWRMESGKDVEVFRWTGRNEYVALCEGEFLSFGGGDGAYGLYIDESLLEGSSARCPTFNNPPLCSSTGMKKGRAVMFECDGLEVWGIGP